MSYQVRYSRSGLTKDQLIYVIEGKDIEIENLKQRDAEFIAREEALTKQKAELVASKEALTKLEAAVKEREEVLEHMEEQIEGILEEAHEKGIEIASAALRQFYTATAKQDKLIK